MPQSSIHQLQERQVYHQGNVKNGERFLNAGARETKGKISEQTKASISFEPISTNRSSHQRWLLLSFLYLHSEVLR